MWTCLAAAAFFTPAAAQQGTPANTALPPAAGSQNALSLDATNLDPNKCHHQGPYWSCELKVPDELKIQGGIATLKLTPKQFDALTK